MKYANGNHSFLLKPLARALKSMGTGPAGFGLLATLPALALAQQLPAGGQVVAGNATINQPDGKTVVINQASNKAIINWQAFSIGNGGHVQFVQPGSSAIALNRVVGQDPSSILGRLSANGQVFLVNPNGVYFGAHATVDVAGIVASTMNIRDEDFLRGDFRFQRDPNAPANATVINAGSINANGGYVVLAGDYVSNTGLIQAQLGSVMLAAGNALTLQMAGSSLVNYAIDEATLAQLAGVSNAGQILASGGKVIMTAEVARQLAGTVVNNSGLVQAQGTVEQDGTVVFTGQGGDVVNSGTVDASGGQNGKAGSVRMRASGDLVHEAGSLITVDAGQSGNGGSIDTWADGKNRFKDGARISGRGGEQGGDGGFVELSGKSVALRGEIDLRASQGRGGELLIDPEHIVIKSGSGVDDDATLYEDSLELLLAGTGHMTLLAQNSGQGNTASIHMEDLADNSLTGTGSGGLTLKVEATDGATGSITFADLNDRIAVNGQLNLSVDDGNGTGVGAIDVGHLQSDTGIDVKAGSISANSMSITRNTSTQLDSAYAIKARAYSGDLNVAGDVRLEVSNDKTAGVATEVDLQADQGKIAIGGTVSSNATGLGYHHTNWVTDHNSVAGNPATSYFGAQPWKKVGEGDHAISTKLNMAAGGDISIGNGVQAVASDVNTAFSTAQSAGGYWQTATANTHNFWRSTAASADASIAAGGDVKIAGSTQVKAEGHATSKYAETESWREMVRNYNYASQNQSVMRQECTEGGCSWVFDYTHTVTNMKGTAKTGEESYIWSFGPYTPSLPASANGAPNVPAAVTDSSHGTVDGPMAYNNVRGLSARLDISAAGSVTVEGVDVRAINHSATGSANYVDANWGHQDTATNLNNTAGGFTSSSQEKDYADSIGIQYTAASTDAQFIVTAGAGSAINLDGAVNVVAAHDDISAQHGKLDFAGMSLQAGSGNGSQDGAIRINGAVVVDGSSDRSIDLAVLNRDGAIEQGANASISVQNRFSAGDASANLSSERAATTLEGAVNVSAGRAASLGAMGSSLTASADLLATGNTSAAIALQASQGALSTLGRVSATGNSTASIDMKAIHGALSAQGALTANGGNATVKLMSATDLHTADTVTANATAASGLANLGMEAGGDLVTDGALSASSSGGTGSAILSLLAAGKLTANADISALALQSQIQGVMPPYVVTGGTSTLSLASNGDMSLNGNLNSRAYRNALMTIASPDGKVSLAAGKTALAQAIGAAFDPMLYTSAFSSTLNISGGSGLNLDGNLSSVAANGAASMRVSTLGGVDAAIEQGVGSTLSVQGRGASLEIKAGSEAALAANAADVQLKGALSVLASQGNALLNLQAASGAVNNFTALSSNGKGQATLATLNGDLGLGGTGIVSGNADAADGARLAVSSSGSISSAAGIATVSNANTGNSAGAEANLSAAGSMGSELGAMSVSAVKHASLNANINGPLSVTGVVDVNASGANASASAMLGSQDKLTVAGTGAISARATGNNSLTTLNLGAGTGMEINGALLSQAGGLASLSIQTLGGADAAIEQGAASQIRAIGKASNLGISAGSGAPEANNAAAISLQGTLVSQGTTGAAVLNIAGKSVAVHDLTASGNTAKVELEALAGTLTADGNIAVTGASNNNAAVLNMASSGAMDTSAAGITLNNTDNGVVAHSTASLFAGEAMTLGAITIGANNAAILNAGSVGNLRLAGDISATGRGAISSASISLGAQDGMLSLDAGKAVMANSVGPASVFLDAALGMQIDGNVSALSSTGAARIDLITHGGKLATIAQGENSIIKAVGQTGAVLGIAAGDASPDGDTAAAVNLAGSLVSHANHGNAQIGIMAASGTVNDAEMIANDGVAELRLAALDEAGNLNLTGTIDVQGDADSDGASLQVMGMGAVNASTATLNVVNLSSADEAQAVAAIGAMGGQLTLGAVNISGKRAVLESGSEVQQVLQGAVRIEGVEDARMHALIGQKLEMQSSVDIHASAGLAELVAMAVDGDIVQAAGSTLTLSGLLAGAALGTENGRLALGGNTVIRGTESAMLMGGGSEVELKNFNVSSTQGYAVVQLMSMSGDFVANGSGSVSGVSNDSGGVKLSLGSQGAIDTRLASLSVSNSASGHQADAAAELMAGTGGIQTGAISVSTAGGGMAGIGMMTRQAIAVHGNLSSIATGNGSAAVQLMSGVETGMGPAAPGHSAPVQLSGAISQAAGSTIQADSQQGHAIIDLQTGNCCSGNINLAGALQAKVASGEGSASIAMRSDQVTAHRLTANTGAHNEGGANINISATERIAITGTVDLKAQNPEAKAGMQLVADQLNWSGGKAQLSSNNVDIQLAPFTPTRLIGVESDQDFDARVQTNYSQAMLKNFTGYGAQIRFGGEVDRSGFKHSALKDLVQQTADIHVAGNGRLDLGDIRMVFDTTGITYYHDPRMSPWSVPAGRMAIFVARPNVDRYLDRTENTLQNMTRALENSSIKGNDNLQVNTGNAGPLQGTTPVRGNLFMAGNGVNTDGEPTGNADAGKPDSDKSATSGDLEQGAERKQEADEDSAG